MSSDSDDEVLGANLFREPEGYYEAEKPPTFIDFTLESGQSLRLRLVGHNPLWGHHLWNAGRVLARRFQQDPSLVAGKSVLELGAGAGLPGLVAALCGARNVVITDYPDQDLVDNLRHNVANIRPLLAERKSKGDGGSGQSPTCEVSAEGYLWGAIPGPAMEASGGFDVLILGDLLFNHSEHEKLVESVTGNLKRDMGSRALVSFTPYRPWLLEKDLAFLNMARREGLAVDKVAEEEMEEVMFKEDRGDEKLRRTVFSYELRWQSVNE